MSVSHPSSIRPFLMFKPCHHAFPNASSPKREIALLPNDDVLPIAGIFTECFEENLLSNGALLPTSAHRSVSFLYQFLVLTDDHEAHHKSHVMNMTPNGPRTEASTCKTPRTRRFTNEINSAREIFSHPRTT
jgi:hypothetical protein